MAKQKEDKQYIDAKGDLHKEFADGRCEIFHKWEEGESQNYMEITDDTDKSINRRRFIPYPKRRPIEDTLITRDDSEETAVPGIDDLEDDDA